MTDKKISAELEAALAEYAPRLPLPDAYADPAFLRCAQEAVGTPELLEQFNRLKGCSLGVSRTKIEQMVDEVTGRDKSEMRQFLEFVHDGIYLRLPDRAINAFRLSAIVEPAESLSSKARAR